MDKRSRGSRYSGRYAASLKVTCRAPTSRVGSPHQRNGRATLSRPRPGTGANDSVAEGRLTARHPAKSDRIGALTTEEVGHGH